MKKTLTLFFIFLIQNVFSQFEYKPNVNDSLCKKQYEKAKEDFRKDNFILNIQKHPQNTETHKIVIEKYGVKVETSKFYINNCYDHKIKELLNDKYGFNFIEHTENEAKKLDKEGKGNRSATLRINESNLKNYVLNNLSKKEKRKLKRKYKNDNIWLAILVDEKGYCFVKAIGELSQIKNLSGYSHEKNKSVEELLIFDLINNKLLYSPSTKNGVSVSSEFITRIDLRK